MKPRILLVDDDQDLCEILAIFLEDEGYKTKGVFSAAGLRSTFKVYRPDIVLLDLVLPDGDGLDLLPEIKDTWPDCQVIVLTGHGSIENAVMATKKGAYQFVCKPFDSKTLLHHIGLALEYKNLSNASVTLQNALKSVEGEETPVFKSQAMRKVLETIQCVAPSDVSILITGESGVGKEVISDLIHATSKRKSGPLIKINCAALPRELIESELFGSVKGAFTGAHADRIGLFRQAEKGTLLLDEISEMPVDIQSKLLRVLQEKSIRPVGGQQIYPTDCRLIAATNVDTQQAIRDGKLREDLFYRISAVTIEIPPLRTRSEEILPLAEMFLKRYAAQASRDLIGFTKEAASSLKKFSWPGNVRQLQNEIQRAVLICHSREIDVDDLSITPDDHKDDQNDLSMMEDIERNAILKVLHETGGNRLETAKRLGIGRQTLYTKIKKFNLS